MVAPKLASAQLLLPIARISISYAKYEPPQRLPRGRRARLLLRRRRRPLLLAVGGVAVDRDPGGRSWALADRAAARRRPPDRRRRRAGRRTPAASWPGSRRPRARSRRSRAGRGGRLRTASFPTAGATLMPQAIAGFRASHPGVEVTLAEGEPEEIAPRLRAGEFDLVLLFEFDGVGERLGAGMRRFELFDDPLHLALPRDHPLADREELGLEDLREESWIQTSAASPCARHVVRSCHAAGFEPSVSFESDDYQTVQGLVAAGVGVAMIPELALSADSRRRSACGPCTRRARCAGCSRRRRGPRRRPRRWRRCSTSCGPAVPGGRRGGDLTRRSTERPHNGNRPRERAGAVPLSRVGGACRPAARRCPPPGPAGRRPGCRRGSRATERPTGTPRARGRRCRRPPFPRRSSAAARRCRPA